MQARDDDDDDVDDEEEADSDAGEDFSGFRARRGRLGAGCAANSMHGESDGPRGRPAAVKQPLASRYRNAHRARTGMLAPRAWARISSPAALAVPAGR
jgi:hypothetical protein